MVTPNEVEAEEITGVEVKDLDSAKQAAAYFREKGVTDVVITPWIKRRFVSSKGKEIVVPAYKVDAIDTTGAGMHLTEDFLQHFPKEKNSGKQ